MLNGPARGTGERPSAALQRLGIARAEFEILAQIRDHHPNHARIVRRLYFSRADGDGAKLIDAGIRDRSLDEMALADARAAEDPIVIDNPGPPIPPYLGYIVLNYFADPTLAFTAPPTAFLAAPRGRFASLFLAALTGDLPAVKRLLRPLPGRTVLDQALEWALRNRLDNSAVITALIRAGANVNVRYRAALMRNSTPLFAAVMVPCDIPALIASGADVGAKNAGGLTALDFARMQEGRYFKWTSTAVKMLEAAATRTHPGGG